LSSPAVIVVGAGIGGLAAAAELAAKGVPVTVVEAQAAPGGKLREVPAGPAAGAPALDAGPTVFTMRWVFDALFDALGTSTESELELQPATILARHAWNADRLDLFAAIDRSADAIGSFAGAKDAAGYRRLCADSQRMFEILDQSFMQAPAPTMHGLIGGVGVGGILGLRHIRPFTTLWQALGDYFTDPRLRQLFGRYSTYCGSSPFQAPATLMLVTHVEQAGVWFVAGGMHRLARAIEGAAVRHGARFRYASPVAEILVGRGRVTGVRLASGERLEAGAVIANTDISALAKGLLGAGIGKAVPGTPLARRSLSAVTFCMAARATGFSLIRHNVFFSGDYEREFTDIFQRRSVPDDPTVYVCAQDRGDSGEPEAAGTERLFCLINAPATGDVSTPVEIDRCTTRLQAVLARSGLQLEVAPDAMTVTTPTDFEQLFPATGGALYGPASHGWQASFQRPGVKTRLKGLYLAGGSAHPGPGVPMATLSGRMAAQALLKDRASMPRSRLAAITGGMSTR
jgi:1-hydroxycarotenoid 3,4-desaturase